MNEQKIKQDLNIGANIRRIRKMRNFGQTGLLQLDGIAITRKTLVQIERGIRNALKTTYDELLFESAALCVRSMI